MSAEPAVGAGDAAAAGSARAEALAHVRRVLLQHGVSVEELDRAVADDVVDLLAADRLLLPGGAAYDLQQVAELTGITPDLALRLWRALGFPDVGPGQVVFSDLDIEAILILRALVQLGVADFESAGNLARVIGTSMARIADTEVSPAVTGLTGAGGPDDSVLAAARLVDLAPTTLPAVARLLEYAWRRHLQAATVRAMELRRRRSGATSPVLALGFADMVGFTLLSQQLAESELAAVVSRFEQVAHDTVTSRRGRVVKMIGDAVMFVCDDPLAAARIALGLAGRCAEDDLLPDVRVGVVWGPVLVQDGDFFGPVVNLASRMVTLAHPGAVLISDELRVELERRQLLVGRARPEPAVPTAPDSRSPGRPGASADPGSSPGVEVLAVSALRPRTLKGVGWVQLWVLLHPDSPGVEVRQRAGRRWERLAEVLRDLDELRRRGEQVVAGSRSSAMLDLGEPDRGEGEGA